MERILAPHEAAVMAAGVRLVLTSDVTGDLDEKTLSDAAAHLQSAYLLLQGNVTTNGGNQSVEVAGGPLARAELGEGTSLDEEINAPVTWAQGPLFRITLLREHERTRIVMTLPRAFADAMSYLAVHSRFWEIYTALHNHEPVPAEVVEPVLGPALDDTLVSLFSQAQLDAFVQERARLDAAAPPAVLPALASANGGPGSETAFRISRVEIDVDQTARLGRLAHENSLTLNELVSAALLVSLRPLLEPAAGKVRMLCTSAVDMRRRVSPALPNEVLQSFATTTSLRLDVDAAETCIEVGRDFSRQLRENIADGAAAMELAAFPYMIDQHPPTLVITNVGTITEPRLPHNLQVTDVALAPLGHLPMIFAVVSRYRDRLKIDLTYSRAWFTDQQIQSLTSNAAGTLNRPI